MCSISVVWFATFTLNDSFDHLLTHAIIQHWVIEGRQLSQNLHVYMCCTGRDINVFVAQNLVAIGVASNMPNFIINVRRNMNLLTYLL